MKERKRSDTVSYDFPPTSANYSYFFLCTRKFQIWEIK